MSKENEENKGVENQEAVSVLDDVFGGESLPEEKSKAVKDDPASLPENPDSDKKPEQEPEEKEPAKAATEEEPEKKEPDKNKVFQQQIKELESRLEASDKRVRDNQTSYHQEHALRLELEKEIAALKEKKKSDDDDDEFGFLDDDEPEEKKKKEPAVDVEKIKNDVASEVEQKVSQKLNEERWNEAETAVKAEHEDYDDIVEKVLIPAIEGNPALQAKFKEMGGTPKAAYELGKIVKDRQDYEADPEAFLARKIQEKQEQEKNKTEPGEPKPKPKITGAGLSKNSAKTEIPINPASKSPLDEVFG